MGWGGLWNFDQTTDKCRLKSGYVGYKHKLNCGKNLDETLFKKTTHLVGYLFSFYKALTWV